MLPATVGLAGSVTSKSCMLFRLLACLSYVVAAAQTRPPVSKISMSVMVDIVVTLPTGAGAEGSVTLTIWMVEPAADTA